MIVREVRNQHYYYSFLFLLLLLLRATTKTTTTILFAAVAAAADHNNQAPHRDEVVAAAATATAKQTTNCIVGQDGTCEEEEEQQEAEQTAANNADDTDDADTDVVDVTHIPLPPVDDTTFLMDIGYGEPQIVSGNEQTVAATKRQLQRMLHYFETVVHNKDDDNNNNNQHPKFSLTVQQECQNRNANCAFWASIGECQVNPAYMLLTCAAACMSCEQLDFHHRCPMPDNVQEMNVWKNNSNNNKAGPLEDMFARIVADYKDQVTILSRPGTFHPVTGEGAWVVQLDDFLTDEECDRLIEWGKKRGYEQSKDVGERKFDGTYDSKEDGGRTSKNTWCLDECYDDPITQGILKKIEDLTGIPDINSEYLQLLQYEEGQFYQSHHDYIPHHIDRPSGPRILTVFLYLNTVEEGGGTYFNDLEITCQPQKGRAVIWPSVLDKAPDQKDARTHHEALPVLKGVKYGANAWIHLRDFKTPYKQGCI